jgi:transcriptional regulator with XRE-family HTH domain
MNALAQGTLHGSWIHGTETPGSEWSSTTSGNLTVLASRHSSGARVLAARQTSPSDAESPVRITYWWGSGQVVSSGSSSDIWAATTRPTDKWPLTVYFTNTDAAITESVPEEAAASSHALLSVHTSTWERTAAFERSLRDSLLGQVRQLSELKEALQTEGAISAIGSKAVKSEAFDVLANLHGSLDLSMEDIASITGISRRTLFLWKQGRVSPRPKTLRPLWRLQALMRGVLDILGERGTKSWLNYGDPSPLDQLIAGRIAVVEEEANRIMFRQSALRPAPWMGARPEEQESVTTDSATPRVSKRKPQRIRIPDRDVRRRDK